MSTSIYSGGLVTKDPHSSEVLVFSWDQDLAPGAAVQTQTFTITAVPTASEPVPLLTKDNELVLTAVQASAKLGRTITVENRYTSLRLIGGTLGKKYNVLNRIVSNESPAQTKDASFTVLIANK